jgi:dimethylglycine dehydrogenase
MVSGYIRMEQKAGLIGIYEKANPNTVWLDGCPWEAEHALFDADYDRIMPWLENAMDRMPVLAECGIRREVHGAITHPPDGNMLLGPAPGLRNFWCCCGSQIGIAWGPGAGKYLAQWMVHGAADINMREFDPRRYGAFADRDYAVTKACEDYLLRHEVPYPGFNRTAGRPVKTSPLYGPLRDHGAVYEEIFGWERPRWYARNNVPREDVHSFRRTAWFEQVAREVEAVQRHVGIMDLSSFAKLEVTGPDARKFIDRMIANRAPRRTGRIVLTHILNERGTIEAETTVVRIDEHTFYLVFAAFSELRIHDWLVQHGGGEDVEIRNVSESLGALALQGPYARNVLRRVTDASLDNESFPWLQMRRIDVAGLPVRAIRVSYTGELGWELHMSMEHLDDVYHALWHVGEEFGVADYGSYAMNSMRMEKMFKGAHELTTEVTLPEADVMRFVKLDKEFIGKPATERSAAGALPWRCIYLEIDANDADCSGSEAVFLDGRKVGAISSGAYGHRSAKSLAFAYVDPAVSKPGTKLEVLILGERRSANILDRPVYDPDNRLPRA